jgi:asparagine synthase (glutamine-hydrolysing)
MCGIVGWVAWGGDPEQRRLVVESMVEQLTPRGPDAVGHWAAPHVALGHRRLVVIDPSGGGQPMECQWGGHAYAITYNGELYNTQELRETLEVRGHQLRTRSDTEVLLHAYLEWGGSCPRHLNGIFAFGIWDGARQRLFLARDRLGVKPLFYAQIADGLVFASELKALLAHPGIPPEVDAEGLAEVFALGPARTPGHGVFRRVRELRPAHSLSFDRRGLALRRYWALESAPHGDDVDTTAARVRSLLTDAVDRQLVSDVPICTLLSGGLDSSAVTALAAAGLERRGQGPLHTYSVDFADAARDFQATAYYGDTDAPWVERVSQVLGTRHHAVVLDTAAQVEALGWATRARDLPGMADVDSSLLLFCREIKRGATVALSGEAADEVFGGYPWCHWEDAIAADTFPWARQVEERVRVLSPEARALLRPRDYVADRYREALSEVPRLPGEAGRAARMREILYLNISRFLGTLLDRKDRMSMAVGLEVRVPFCDHRLVEYVWNIPWAMKSLDGQSKGILRRALHGLLPEDVLARRKTPYPKTHSRDYLLAVRQRLLHALGDPSSPLRPLLDVEEVTAIAQQEPPQVHWFGQTMAGPQFLAFLLQAEEWLRAYRVRIVA